MALPTITKMQKTAQEMLNKNKEQLAASTSATQSGSTSTPTTTTTPKVTSTPKAKPSVTQQTVTSQIVSTPTQPVDLTKINLFKPQEAVKTTQQIKQQYGDLLAKQQDKKDVQAGPIPGSVINAANTVGGETQTQVKKTVLQQFKDWFKRTDEKMQKSSEQFREKAWEDYYVGDFWKNLIWGETQAEEYIARLTDKLAGEGNEGYVEAFEKGQGEFWRQEIDSYNKYVEAAKAGDISSQEFGKKVGEFMNKLSGGKWSGEGWAELASSTASTLKDPRQFVGNLGNMLPWLVLSQAGGLGLGMAYGTAQQSEDVYEDFSTDEGITNNLNDNQIFLMSSGVGAVLSLVEGLGDILGDLPWAKTFSKNIRGTIGKILKKDISKTLVKDIEDSLEKDIKKEFRNPIKNAISKWFKGGLGELAEEPIQNEIQNEVAIGAGSNRQHYTLAQLATMGIISFVYGSALQTIGLPVNIKQNQDLKNSYKEWSNEVDKVAPGLKEEVKENMFASLVAAQIRDTQLSDKKLNRYQKQAEDLYNQKAELESQLENTTDPWVKQTINNQIKDIDTKINDIDQKVNQWQNTADEINKQLEEISSKSELPVQQSMPQQQGGENLSQQTMPKGMVSGVSQPTIRKINTKLKQVTDNKEIENLQKEKDKILKPYIANMQEWINKPISEYTDSDLYAMEEVIFSDGSLTKDKYEKAREIMDEMEKRQGFVDEMTIRELEEEAEVESGKRKEALEREIKDRKYNAKLSFMKDMSADVKAMSDDELELFSDELFDRILSKKMLNDTLLVEKYKEVSNELRLRGLVEGKDGLHTAGVHSLSPGADINTIISVAIDEFAAGSYAVKDLDRAIEEIQKNITKSKWYNKISLMSQSVIDELYYPSAKNEKPGEVLELLKRRRENLFNNMREKVLGSPSIMKGILSNQLGKYYGQTASNDLINLFSARGVTIRSTFYDKDGSIKPMTQEEAIQWSKTISAVCKVLGINLDKLYRDTSMVINSHNKQSLPSSDSQFKTLGLFKPYNEYSRAIAFSTERDDNTLVHEILHSIELKLLLDAGFEYDSNFGWVSDENGHILSNDQIKLLLDNVNSGKGDINYRERPAELFARIGEQYFAEKVGDTRYRNEPWYWNKDFFDSTIKPMVEDVLKNSGYQYEQGESIEADILYNLGLLNKDLKDIESRAIEKKISTNDVAAELNNLQSRYDEIDSMVESMPEGNEKDEMMLEMSSLSENIRLLAQGGEEYFDMQRNTKGQQTQMNNGVNEISDNGTYLMSEVEDNQQEGDVIDDAMKEEIENDKEPDTTGPLDIAVNKVVNKVEKSVDKMIKDKNKKNAIREVGQGIKDVFTPALSRLYSISPRLAGAVHTYQASVGLKTLGYKRLSENFVKELDKLKKKNPEAYKKLSLALFDWGMNEDIDIKEALKEAGLDEKLFEPVVSILNQIATEYQSAGLDITINDKYFPRKVKDYGLLLDYLSRKSGKNIEGTKEDLLNRIKNINEDPSLSDGEKEVRIHNILINEFTKPSERSNNAKERKLILSEWLLTDEDRKQGYKNDITDFYEDPIVSLSNYIDDMVKKTELKKMLGGLTNEKTAISEEFDDSIAKILLDMEARGELTPEKAEEAKKVIKSIVNARATGKGAQGIKNAVYSMTIANRLSAAQQLEDLSKALLRGPTGFKNIVKSIIGKANIKMDDTGLENAFAQFEGGNITDTLFKLSGFDAVDALGKNSFLNTAWDSCVRQANSEKRNIILKTRLTQMYGEEMGNSIFESYKNNELRDKDGHLKLDVMVDLMYQLGNTQPIYKSAMPTAYLNNPKIRVVYCLWSFTVKQVDWFIQGTKEVYNNQRLLGRSKEIASMAATGRCIGALSVVSIISAMVSDLINWAKGDDDELMFKKWEEEGFGAFLKQFGINSLSGLLKIFNISKYDQYIFKREGIGGVLMSKITPAPVSIFSDIGQVLLGKKELASMGKYMPLFLKPLYYQFKNRDMLPDYKLWGGETETKKSKGTSDKFGKTSVGTKGPSDSSKFGGYSVQ